jgi:hypothetical protein
MNPKLFLFAALALLLFALVSVAGEQPGESARVAPQIPTAKGNAEQQAAYEAGIRLQFEEIGNNRETTYSLASRNQNRRTDPAQHIIRATYFFFLLFSCSSSSFSSSVRF